MKRFVLVLVAVAASACASRSRPPETRAPASGSQVLEAARGLIGAPYRNGGSSPSGFDCSGLVRYVFSEIGVNVPRSVQEQAAVGEVVRRDRLRPGDLVFFAIDGRTVSHVGIASGAGTFVHAPSSRGTVREEALSSPYWDARYHGARRVLPR